jgi:hypothetical protein
MQPIDFLGTTPLFLGVETADWSLEQFEAAANAASALGITSLLIKIADGGNIWYEKLGGWQKVLATVKPTTAVPTALLQAIKTKVAELEALIAQLP